jgi:hypothetical protein
MIDNEETKYCNLGPTSNITTTFILSSPASINIELETSSIEESVQQN